ncbi:TRAP transporter large permease subunit [Acuticoccus sp. I52.16.1]|uniref:TRAP transporter large permease n=1 Tax=Acuticoccus sp. I52.16.1 TaxID=2928472 RepID=UPI001FD5C271|nr:TRAP transporter large permease subunit [Acuticoccus sp. I52.16.1]UOM35889.1 TRAP transporter large permease subunit [Acuticoccus sp. I52.16.1]
MLDILMFAGLVVGILSGFPAAFAIAGTAMLFALVGAATGEFDLSFLGALGQRIYGILVNPVLIAIPLFVFMGVVLEKSRIAEELLTAMGRAFGRMPGGLGISVVLVGALLAASTGIVGATVVAMGLIALPAMMKAGYSASLGAGIVATSGTLGQIIPPSTLLIILSDVMSNAYQQAQFDAGKFTIDTISVGETFAAALLPGLALVAIYIAYLLVRALIRPADVPPLTDGGRVSRGELARVVAPPIALILAVLGSILGGVATPSEAAAVGAVGAVLMAGARLGGGRVITVGAVALGALAVLAAARPIRLQRSDTDAMDLTVAAVATVLLAIGLAALGLALWRLLRRGTLREVAGSTMTVTAMIFATIITASMFSLVFVGLGGETRVEHILESMPGGATGALLFAMGLIFVLGFFLDFVEISVILLPLVVPALITMGHDPTWLAVLIAINLQTSFLTPPFGFSLFYLRGAAPPEVSTAAIYRGVAPFILLQGAGVALVWFLPQLATFLPGLFY